LLLQALADHLIELISIAKSESPESSMPVGDAENKVNFFDCFIKIDSDIGMLF